MAFTTSSVQGSRVSIIRPARLTRTFVGRRQLRLTRAVEQVAVDLVNSIPADTLAQGASQITGAILAAGILTSIAAAVAYTAQAKNPQGSGVAKAMADGQQSSQEAALPRENAVLVLGASGRLGQRVVQRLLNAGRTVVAAARSVESVEKVLGGQGLQPGKQQGNSGVLFYEAVDVRDLESLRQADVWKGVSQVVLVLAGKAGMLPSGQFGYFDGLGPEDVEAKGICNVMTVLPEVLPPTTSMSFKTVVPMGNEQEVAVWDRMDDVIMGGNSASQITAAPDVGPNVARWTGQLIVEGGGFCGARTKVIPGCDLSAYDGIAMRVKGDGSIFKLNIKTTEQLDAPESTYQTTFDTVAGQWHDVHLPWHNFVPVKRAQSDPEGAPLDPSRIAKFGLVLSRFEFNKMPNPVYKPGSFELLMEGGIRAFKAVRPQVVQLSSAGVERNAIIGDDAEKRKLDVPIVQLNPGGVLNHKYEAEIAVRSSGYPYTVVRSTGMIDSNENGPFLLDVDQGDKMSGSIGRDDVADVLVATLNAPEAAYKTFEVRRSEALDGRGKAMTGNDYTRMFLKLAMDRNRWRVGLQPFPKYVPPPAKQVSEEEKQEIKQNIAEIRSKFKASGMGVQEDPQSQQQQQPTEEKQKEVVTASSR